MSTFPEIRQQLQTLRIPHEQRPAGRRRVWGGLKVLAVLAMLVGLGIGAYLERDRLPVLASASAAEVRVMTVAPRAASEVPPVLTATGKIVSDHRVQVSTKVSGQIVALYFEQGDRVKRGQLLARIEDVNYRARRDEAQARLLKSKANLEFQTFNHQRTAGLFEKESAPQIEYADAKRAMHEADAQVAADQAVLDYAQKALDDCEVLAPIEGVVIERNVEVGDFVAAEGGRGAIANAQFAIIADMNKLRVEVDVSELDIARLRPGMPCTIAPEAYKDRRYRGHVLWIDPGANYAKATVQVKVRIDDPDEYLRVEGSAQVTFLPENPTTAPAVQASGIWIPSTACVVNTSGELARVFVVRDGRLQERAISVGRRIGGQIEVMSGLAAGESIAADRIDKLADGQRVKS